MKKVLIFPSVFGNIFTLLFYQSTTDILLLDMLVQYTEVFHSCVVNVPSLPSREQERAAEGVMLLMLGSRVHCRAPQPDDAPATWLS